MPGWKVEDGGGVIVKTGGGAEVGGQGSGVRSQALTASGAHLLALFTMPLQKDLRYTPHSR